MRALLIAVVLGALAGSISALFVTVMDAKGLVVSPASRPPASAERAGP